MNSPLIQAIGAVLDAGWTMLTTIRFPGTEIPIAIILVGMFVAYFGIKILAYVLVMRVDVGDIAERMDKTKNPEKWKRRRGL